MKTVSQFAYRVRALKVFCLVVGLLASLPTNSQTIEAVDPILAQQPSAIQEGQFRTGVIIKYGLPHYIRYRVLNGRAIYQGDVELGSVQEMDRQVQFHTRKDISFAQVAPDNRWPGAVVTYQINSDSFPSAIRANWVSYIEDAIEHWERRTVLRFKKRTTEHAYLVFNHTDDEACYSDAIGYRVAGPQFIRLNPRKCRGSIVHEIGHAVGLFHEHTRCDRDEHININWPNVAEPEQFYRECALAFYKDIARPDAAASGPYDYASVMHYGKGAFAKDPNVDTIRAPVQRLGGAELSRGDREAVNAMYAKWTKNEKIRGHENSSRPTLITFADQLHMFYVVENGEIHFSIFNGSGWQKQGAIKNANGWKLSTPRDVRSVSAAVHDGKLFIAYSGNNHSATVASLTRGDTVWQDVASLSRDRKGVTYDSPAIASFNNRLYMVFLPEKTDYIYFTFLRSDGKLEDPLRLPVQRAFVTPALVPFQNKLHMVHRSLREPYVLYHSTFDGILWSPNRKISGQAAVYAPSLAVFDDRIHLVHSGGNPQYPKRMHYSFYGPDGTWRPDVVIEGQESKAPVGLAAGRDRLHMVHLGGSEDQIWSSSLCRLVDLRNPCVP